MKTINWPLHGASPDYCFQRLIDGGHRHFGLFIVESAKTGWLVNLG